MSNEPAVSISQSPPISQFPGTSSKGDREPSWVRRILLITVILLFLAGSALLIYSSAQGQMPTTNNHNNATGTALAQMHAASSSTAQAGDTATAQSIALAQNKATATAVAQANAAANASATAAARGTATTVAQNNAEATAIAQANANGTATAQNNATATAIAQANANATATAIGQANATATAQANATATAVASQNPYPPHNGTLVLNDPLSDNSQGHHWDERTDCVFTGGAYHVSEAQQGYFNACYARSTNFSNFTYEVHMTIVQGDDSSSGGGIVFRTFDDVHTNLYALTIRLDGSYSLYVHNGSAGARLLASGSSSAIHTGLNQSNVIAVVANGSNIDLYVNDQQIDSVSDSTYSQGDIGVFTYNGGSGAEAVFSNAKVWTQ